MKIQDVKPGNRSKTAPKRAEKGLIWAQWLEAMLENTQELKSRISKEDWEGVETAILARGQLFEGLPSALAGLHPDPRSKEGMNERQQAKRFLERLLSLNNEFVEKLGLHLQAMGQKVGSIKQGRKALGLYKPPRNERPRFVNRLG